MKKTVALLMALILVLSFAVNVSATGTQSIVLGNAKFTEADEIKTISVEANNLDRISLIHLFISFDSTKVELLNVEERNVAGEIVPIVVGAETGTMISVPSPQISYSDGVISILWDNEQSSISGSGIIANFSFKALSDDVGTVKLSYTTYDGDSSYICRDNAGKVPEVVEEVEFLEKPVGVNVSGTVTSYLDETETVTIGLYEGENAEPTYETTVTGNSAEYSIQEVEAGTYTMKVSKAKHVAREYSVTVNEEDVEQDAKIHPIGDINGDGKIAMVDYLRARQHAQSVQTLTGYEFACADINGDSRVVMVDYMRIRQHAQNISKLW